ncbi:MAG: hypothetical protein H6706_21590 [Myxococcales bacterium]|nr:hypothetical protein [Myxococcales bacterium]
MRYALALLVGLAGCTLDPDELLEQTELQVTVVGIDPSARTLRVAVERDEAAVADLAPTVEGQRMDVWFAELPVGAYTLVVETDAGQRCERALTNTTGPQQEVVDLAVACPDPAEVPPGDGEHGGEEGHDD